MQTKPQDHDQTIMMKTTEMLNPVRVSSHTVDDLAEDVNKILAAEDLEDIESPEKFQIIKPKMAHSPPKSSQRKISPKGSSSKVLNKQPSRPKRKSALSKTKGGVEPWQNEDKTLRQQSVLSFARLGGETDDEDAGPVVKDQDSVEFLLQKDNSVQKLEVIDDLNARASLEESQEEGTSSKKMKDSKAKVNVIMVQEMAITQKTISKD